MNKLLWWVKFCMMFAVGDDDAGGEITLDDVTADSDNPEENTDDEAKEPETMVDAIKKGLEEANPEAKTDLKDGTDTKPKAEEKKPAVETAKTPEQQAEEKAAAEKAKKTISDDDLKMPEGLSAKAQDRFTKLSNGYKEVATELTTTKEALNQAQAANMEFVTVMDNVGAGPENLNIFIDYMASIKEGNFEQAHKILSAQMDDLSLRMGKELPGVDLLNGYPDLVQDVENLDISRERAIEIARARKQQEQETAVQTKQTQTVNQQQEWNTLVQTTMKDVDSALQQLKAHDIDYEAKERIIMAKSGDKPSILERIVQGSHPSTWLNQVQLAYDAIQITKPSTPRNPNPIRPSGGGGEAAPNSMLEALKSGLGYNG